MGGCVSSGSSARAPGMSALDLALTSRLQTYIATHPEVHASKSLTKVALSFTAMLRSFEAIRVVFTRVDADGNGQINYNEFTRVIVADDIMTIPEPKSTNPNALWGRNLNKDGKSR